MSAFPPPVFEKWWRSCMPTILVLPPPPFSLVGLYTQHTVSLLWVHLSSPPFVCFPGLCPCHTCFCTHDGIRTILQCIWTLARQITSCVSHAWVLPASLFLLFWPWSPPPQRQVCLLQSAFSLASFATHIFISLASVRHRRQSPSPWACRPALCVPRKPIAVLVITRQPLFMPSMKTQVSTHYVFILSNPGISTVSQFSHRSGQPRNARLWFTGWFI